jgi:NAD(P)-dependent dehydrogenase (short-subunit alcohol dehydrogenase family)
VAAEVSGLAHAGDVSDEAHVQALMAACEAAFGRLDVLVNNAGVAGARRNTEEMEPAAFARTLAVNVRGAMLCIKRAAPLLKRAAGAIVNLTSLGVRPGRGDYVASKWALRGLTQAAAFELGPFGVRVNELAPGTVNTEMSRLSVAQVARREGRAEDDVKAHYLDKTALGRMVEPAEVAAAALFLAGDGASAITGTELVVNAGRM